MEENIKILNQVQKALMNIETRGESSFIIVDSVRALSKVAYNLEHKDDETNDEEVAD